MKIHCVAGSERKLKGKSVNDETIVNNVEISNKKLRDFKHTHGLLEDVTMSLQSMTSSNTLSVDGKEYFLDDIVTSVPIFTEDATYMHNGNLVPLPQANIFQEEYDEEIVTVVKNVDENIEFVRITNKIKNEIVDMKTISPGIFATIKESDYNVKYQTPSYHRRTQEGCISYDIMELAVAYESSFCTYFEGQDRSDLRVMSLVADVSIKFQQLCVKVYISHLEGYCNSASDPYKQYVDLNLSGCGNVGLVDGLQTYWNENRVNVARDAMMLFSGTSLECHELSCVNSCSHIGSICNNNFAYGAAHVTVSPSENLQAVLVASELGHICGAGHVTQTGYIMYEFLNSGSLGFDDTSIKHIQDRFTVTSCITQEGVSLPPVTQIPTKPSSIPSSIPSNIPSSLPTITQSSFFPTDFGSLEPTINPTKEALQTEEPTVSLPSSTVLQPSNNVTCRYSWESVSKFLKNLV